MNFIRLAHILEKIKTKTKTKNLTKAMCTQFSAPKGADCWARGSTDPIRQAHKAGADFDRPELTGGEVPGDGMSTSVLPIIPRIYQGGSRLRRRAVCTAAYGTGRRWQIGRFWPGLGRRACAKALGCSHGDLGLGFGFGGATASCLLFRRDGGGSDKTVGVLNF
jgi:hypothetical protein